MSQPAGFNPQGATNIRLRLVSKSLPALSSNEGPRSLPGGAYRQRTPEPALAQRIILYTGKGGVGKTTVAAATALRIAELGHRTVVLSTDPAHSLADAFGVMLGPEPVPVVPNLWGQETDVYHNLRRYWGTVHDWLRALLAWQGVDEMEADEVAAVPGMEELANLLWINRHHESQDYDVVIVDCAPTGETLRLLSFPDSARWWIDKLLPLQRRLSQVLRPVMRPITGIPVPDQEVFEAVEDLMRQLGRLHATMSDRELSSVRLVVNPEKMVIRETQRTFTYLNLYGYVTDAVACNRVLPASVGDGYFAHWKEAQEGYLQLIHEAFSPLPILTVPLLRDEITGLKALREMARHLYGSEDPTRIYYPSVAHEVRPEDGGFVLSLGAPFVTKAEVSLAQRGDELSVQVGTHRRNVLLPRVLSGLRASSARVDHGRLNIYFPREKGRKGASRTGSHRGEEPRHHR
jgi:arsenite-transporting ATPase